MPKPPAPTTHLLGHYALGRKLGSGAMGQVWLARDRVLKREVALKVLTADASSDSRGLNDFLREAQSAAQLNHPNTAIIFEVGKQGEKVFIAMEYIEAGSLADELANKGALGWRDATQAIRDAAAGLKHAHERGLVHRDVKPSNLMRSSSGLVKVVDFGLAKAQQGKTDLTMTRPGVLIGSPAYMSPEQCRGETVDARSDLYSLICTYYELLTRQIPFTASEFTAAMYQHCHEPFPDPRGRGIDVPPAVCNILEKGSRKDPSQRYQNASELLADLNAALSAPADSGMVTLAKDTSSALTGGGRGTDSAGEGTGGTFFTSILKGQGIMGKTTWTLVILTLAWLSYEMLHPPVAPTGDDPALLSVAASPLAPVPALSAQHKAEQTIKSILKDDYAKRTAADRTALALKLIAQGQQDSADAVMRYVLFREARDTAAMAGNVTVSFQAIDELSQKYAIDAVDQKTAAFVMASVHAPTADDNRALAEPGLELLNRAGATDHFTAAARLGPLLESIARKSRDIALLSKVQARNTEIADQRHQFDQLKAAFDALRTNPADPEANLAVGRYLCFSKGNWDTGVPMLAKGSDASVKDIASKELSNPAEPKVQLAIADGWWNLAAKQTAPTKGQIERHAAIWYQKAVLVLEGADKARAESRLPADAPKPVVVATKPPDKVTPAASPQTIPPAHGEPPSHTDAQGHRVLDLLPFIDVDRASGWRRTSAGIKEAYQTPLSIAYVPPPEYDFTVGFICDKTLDFTMLLTHGDRQFNWRGRPNADGSTMFGFYRVAGMEFAQKENPTTVQRQGVLAPQKQHSLTVRVRNAALSAYVDGELLSEFATDYSNLGLPPMRTLNERIDDGGLGFFGRTLVNKLELVEVNGKGHVIPLPLDDPHLTRSYALREADHAPPSSRTLRFTPDGRYLVEIGSQATVWERTNGNVILNRKHSGGGNASATLSPDGHLMAVVDGSLPIGSGEVVEVAPHTRSVTVPYNLVHAAFSPDGSRLATLNYQKSHVMLTLLDVATMKPIATSGDAQRWRVPRILTGRLSHCLERIGRGRSRSCVGRPKSVAVVVIPQRP